LQDARAIAALAKKGSRVVQLGAGFIGCIIMQALAERGVKLLVVEMGDRMVPRMMTPTAGNMIREWVEFKGITVRTKTGVEHIAAGTDSPLMIKLSTGETLPCDLLIVAAGVAPNTSFLKGAPIEVGKGVRVDIHMRTSSPDIYAAGDVAEAPDLFTGTPQVAAIQPNAADQSRVAALNMAGQNATLPGVLSINVLDTLGLISSSFGQWSGTDEKDGVELVDKDRFRYLSLQFQGDVLIGATSIGLTQHVGVLRGLIQNRTRLGRWKSILKESPLRFPEAYVACSQQPVALLH
jgi:NADPH-dependent 2,4-dienoyl-CoA reductase/sulfur reductase-like enzyme